MAHLAGFEGCESISGAGSQICLLQSGLSYQVGWLEPMTRVRIMKKLLLAIFSIATCMAFWAPTAAATDIYVAQNGAGAGAGTSCANALPVAWFNVATNWGGGNGQIGPGTIVHLCGTFTGAPSTTLLTMQGNGVSGNPITVLFEAGAVLTSPYWNASSGAITCNGKSFITIDGGSNGIIQNSDDGNNGQGNDQQSGAIELSQCNNVIVKNLTIHNIYIQQPQHVYSSCSTRVDSFAVSVDGGSHIRVSNLVIDHVRIGIAVGDGGVGGTDYEVDHNTLTYVEVHTGASSGSLPHTNFRFHDNHFGTGAYIYDNPLNCYHHEAFHGFGSGSPYPDQVFVYNNLVDGIWGTNDSGQHITAGFFTEFVGPNVVYANNIIDFSTGGVGNEPDNGFIFCKGDGAVDGSNHCELYNNTFLSQGTFGTSFEAQLGASQMQFQNNIVVGADGPDAGGDYWAVKPNNNVYFTTSTWHVPAGGTNWSGWQSYGADANGNGSSNPGTYANVAYVPPAGSSPMKLGANLTSKCSTYAWLCFDKNGNPRPANGPWVAGAVAAPSSGATNLSPATGLAAVGH
jgi:hypothetical protein